MAVHVLVVENLPEMYETVRDVLKRYGYKVYVAEGRIQAEGYLKQRRIDAAIIDVRLGDETDQEDWSGLILARDVAGRGIPVIILSAYDKREDVERAFDVAPDVAPPYEFVSKNREDWPKTLAAVLQEALGEQEQGRVRRLLRWLRETFPAVLKWFMRTGR